MRIHKTSRAASLSGAVSTEKKSSPTWKDLFTQIAGAAVILGGMGVQKVFGQDSRHVSTSGNGGIDFVEPAHSMVDSAASGIEMRLKKLSPEAREAFPKAIENIKVILSEARSAEEENLQRDSIVKALRAIEALEQVSTPENREIVSLMGTFAARIGEEAMQRLRQSEHGASVAAFEAVASGDLDRIREHQGELKRMASASIEQMGETLEKLAPKTADELKQARKAVEEGRMDDALSIIRDLSLPEPGKPPEGADPSGYQFGIKDLAAGLVMLVLLKILLRRL